MRSNAKRPAREMTERRRLHALGGPTLSTGLFLFLAAAFLVFLATRFDLDISAALTTVYTADPVALAGALAVYYASFAVRGLRWRILIQAADPQGAEPSSLAAYAYYVVVARFVDSISWLRVGSVYRAYLVSEAGASSFTRAIGTLVAEHYLDAVVVLAGVVAVAPMLAAGDDNNSQAGVAALAAGAIAVATAALLLMRRFRTALERILPGRLATHYGQFHDGAFGGMRMRFLPALTMLSTAGWAMAAARWYLVLEAIGVSVELPLLVAVSLVNALLAAIPFTPGGLGVVEPGVIGVLSLQLPVEDAVAAIVVERAISYLSLLAIGALLLFGREAVRRHGARRDAAR